MIANFSPFFKENKVINSNLQKNSVRLDFRAKNGQKTLFLNCAAQKKTLKHDFGLILPGNFSKIIFLGGTKIKI